MTDNVEAPLQGRKVSRSRLGSTRSLSRQRRVRSVDDVSIPMNEPSSASSAQSIPHLSHASSARSLSPFGDYMNGSLEPSILQRATWLISQKKQGESGEEKPRGLLSMGRTIQRTGSQLRKTRLYHIFYVLVVPIYTVLGALFFQMLDGKHDDRLIMEYQNRCNLDRNATMQRMKELCGGTGAEEGCFEAMKNYLQEVENCYRNWHTENRTVTHSMSNFSNALVYAFSVYTTIGYGNMAADTVECRVATIVYGALGIPLFFAFVKEAGNLCRQWFIGTYNFVGRLKKRHCRCKKSPTPEESVVSPKQSTGENGNVLSPTTQRPVILISEGETKRARFSRKYSTNSLFGASGKLHLDEQRRVFLAGVIVFVLYILLVSWIFSMTTEFDYFTSVYFLFNSVALIGFGDVFPSNPAVILMNTVFIVLGVVLFSMCYFILQEEIRNQAFEASRRARISISKYSHTIMQHAQRSAWSRRNSPLLDNSSENTFERMRKRRQSAPAVTLTVPPRSPRR